MNNSKRIKCYLKNGGSSKQCLLNGVHTDAYSTAMLTQQRCSKRCLLNGVHTYIAEPKLEILPIITGKRTYRFQFSFFKMLVWSYVSFTWYSLLVLRYLWYVHRRKDISICCIVISLFIFKMPVWFYVSFTLYSLLVLPWN